MNNFIVKTEPIYRKALKAFAEHLVFNCKDIVRGTGVEDIISGRIFIYNDNRPDTDQIL